MIGIYNGATFINHLGNALGALFFGMALFGFALAVGVKIKNR